MSVPFSQSDVSLCRLLNIFRGPYLTPSASFRVSSAKPASCQEEIYILQSSCPICFVANEISWFHCLCWATQHNPKLAVCCSPSHHKRCRIPLWASSRLLLACNLAQTVVTVMWVTMCQQANTDLELRSSLSCGKPYHLGSMKAGTKTTVSHYAFGKNHNFFVSSILLHPATFHVHRSLYTRSNQTI